MGVCEWLLELLCVHATDGDDFSGLAVCNSSLYLDGNLFLMLLILKLENQLAWTRKILFHGPGALLVR